MDFYVHLSRRRRLASYLAYAGISLDRVDMPMGANIDMAAGQTGLTFLKETANSIFFSLSEM